MTIITPTGITGITSITSTGNTLQFTSASGGNLDVNGLNVTSGTNINVSGIVTASGGFSGNINSSGLSTVTTLRATSVVGVNTLGVTTAYIGAINDGAISGARNRIINGDMRIDQRNGGVSLAISGTSSPYALDRWKIDAGTDGAVTVIRSAVAPVGFTNSLLFTTTTADSSLSANQQINVQQNIEGYNIADLNWGTSNAQPITISFWTRSSLTGTFTGRFTNNNASRSYVFTYTINSANTWEYKTITIPGDTTGTWTSDNTQGIQLLFCLGSGTTYLSTAGSWQAGNLISVSGAVSVIGTLNATWYLTGVQLEAGTVATPFERRYYGQELVLCQRYYETGNWHGMYKSSDDTMGWVNYKVTKRTNPSITSEAPGSTTTNRAYYYSTSASDLGSRIVNEINQSSWMGGLSNLTGGFWGGIYNFTPVSANDATFHGIYRADAEL